MKHFICATALATALIGVGQTSAAEPAGRLPQGDYRIDSEAVITHSSPAGTLTRTQQIDGATGRTTLTDKTPDGVTATRTLAGQGPYRWCMAGAAAGKPTTPPDVCTNGRYSAHADGFNLSTNCGGVRGQEQWRRIDERTWERVMHTSYSTSLSNMPKQTEAAMAPVIAALEEQLKSGNADEAAQARQQLDLLKGRAPSDTTTIDLRERWTRVADACTGH